MRVKINLRKCRSQKFSDPRHFDYARMKDLTPSGKRQLAFEDTKKRLDSRSYLTSSGDLQTISEDDCNDALLQSTVEEFNFGDTPEGEWFPAEKRPFEKDPTIAIINRDCIDVARALSEIYTDDKVAMLNMANSEQPGGHYLLWQIAQEESIFFRTNIYKFLDPECKSGDPSYKHKHYPLPQIGGLYVPNVLSIRKEERVDYRLCKAAHTNVICVAGLDMRNIGVYLEDKHGVIIKNKIRTIFRIAIEKGQTVLVLGALGCGAFGNDSLRVARFFNEVIQETKGFFKAIVFSIISLDPRRNPILDDFKLEINSDKDLEKNIADTISGIKEILNHVCSAPQPLLSQSTPGSYFPQGSFSPSQSPFFSSPGISPACSSMSPPSPMTQPRQFAPAANGMTPPPPFPIGQQVPQEVSPMDPAMPLPQQPVPFYSPDSNPMPSQLPPPPFDPYPQIQGQNPNQNNMNFNPNGMSFNSNMNFNPNNIQLPMGSPLVQQNQVVLNMPNSPGGSENCGNGIFVASGQSSSPVPN